jgi:hypothetical protein
LAPRAVWSAIDCPRHRPIGHPQEGADALGSLYRVVWHNAPAAVERMRSGPVTWVQIDSDGNCTVGDDQQAIEIAPIIVEGRHPGGPGGRLFRPRAPDFPPNGSGWPCWLRRQ